MTVLLVVETAVLALLCVLVAGLLRAYAEVLRRLHALDGEQGAASTRVPPLRTDHGVVAPLPVDIELREEWTAAHDLSGTSLSGEIVVLPVTGTDHDTVLAFLSSGCDACQGFWTDLATPGYEAAPGARLVVVTKDEQDESLGELRRLAAPDVDVVMSSRAWEAYEVPGSPFIVVVDGATGRVKGHGSGGSFGQVSALMARAGRDHAPRSVRKPRADVEREGEVDRLLLDAGITPGHPSLYAGADPGVDDGFAR